MLAVRPPPGPAVAHQPPGVDAVGGHDAGGGGLQVGGGEAQLAPAAPAVDHDAAQAVGAAQDVGGLAHPPVPQALAHPGRRPAAAPVGTDLAEDLHFEAVGGTDLLQDGGVPGIAAPEAHVAADDEDAHAEQALEPGAHELPGALGGEVQVVGDDEDGVQAQPLQGGQAVGQGGDEGQVLLGAVDAARVRVESNRHRQGAPPAGGGLGELVGALHDAAQDRLVPAVHAVEDADGHHAARSPGLAQCRGHLLGAVPDLHRGQSCSPSTRRAPRPAGLAGQTLPRPPGPARTGRVARPCSPRDRPEVSTRSARGLDRLPRRA